jgi:hypothetical protein
MISRFLRYKERHSTILCCDRLSLIDVVKTRKTANIHSAVRVLTPKAGDLLTTRTLIMCYIDNPVKDALSDELARCMYGFGLKSFKSRIIIRTSYGLIQGDCVTSRTRQIRRMHFL